MAANSLWAAIFWFEIRYQLKQPLFYLVTFVLSVLLFITGTDSGASGRLHLNAPAVILEQLLKWIYLVLFMMTAFVASAAVRDFDRRTAELFFSKPIGRFDYLTARYAGSMVVCTLPYLIGTLALAISSLMPGLDAARLGPVSLAPYVFGLGVLILPTLIALGALFYALASWTRSTLATYLGVVAFLAASATAGLAASQLETQWLAQLLDPFGVIALSSAVKYLTVAELNATIPGLHGPLLWNRVLWLCLGFGALGVAVVTFNPERTRWRVLSRLDLRSLIPARAGVQRDSTVVPLPSGNHAGALRLATNRVFTRRTVFLQFAQQVRREVTTVFLSLPFLGMLAFGLFVLVQAASSAGNVFGMPVYPATYLMLESLQDKYSVILLLVVVLYSGELIWKERSLELNEVVDSMPTPNSVFFGAKLTALLLVIAAFLLAGVVALVVFQLANQYNTLELGLYARGAAKAAVYPVLMMVFGCFCHVMARNKLVGYGLVLLFIVFWDLLEEYGFEHHLYRYASLPAAPYTDFNGYGPFLAPFGAYSTYWGFVAVAIAGISLLFWSSGTDVDWRSRWVEARARFKGATRAAIAVGAVAAVVVGSWIFYNTNVLNAYVPSTDALKRRAHYEQLYSEHQSLDLPRIIGVRSHVDIFPEQQSVRIRGSYELRNRSNHALQDIHVSIPDGVVVNELNLPAHDVIVQDDTLGYRIYRLHKPMDPDAAIGLGFDFTASTEGFVNNGAQIAIVANGTHFTKRDFFPVIGYDVHRQLTDPDERRQHGLESRLRLASVDDTMALRSTPRASDADRVEFESTVSTSLDQIAVTSGELTREWVERGRRYFHYRAELPITHHYAFASARYEVARSEWNGVAIEVYHHPAHDQNVARIMDAARKSLAYYSESFGPYQHTSLRIVEFPGYVRDATAFPGVITFSESMGFNARLNGAQAIDYPFYVTAHEIAHQWWGQQLVGANVQGVPTLHETLAQYSALMVMENEFARQKMPRVLAHEHEWYLRGRGGEREVEAPLALVERQDYVYYHKGALAMYALRDAVGESSLNLALKRYLARFALGGPPYSTTSDLRAELRQSLPAGSAPLLAQLFETMTTFNVKVEDATFVERADGTFVVRVELAASKRVTDSTGAEREVPMDDVVDVAVYSGEAGAVESALEARRVGRASSVQEIVVKQLPTRVVIDPYFKLIDRERGNNVRAVMSLSGQAARGSVKRPTQ